MDERSEKGYEVRGENGMTKGKCAKTEKSENNYERETLEVQLPTTLHLMVTWVLGLSM